MNFDLREKEMTLDIANLVLNFGKEVSPDITEIISAFITPMATLIAAFGGSFMTYKLYEKQRTDNETKECKTIEELKIKNINILLIQLLDCINDTLANLNTVEDQKEYAINEYKNNQLYVVCNNCNTEIIINILNEFVIDLPGFTYRLNNMKDLLVWAETYRNRRNEAIKNRTNEEHYEKLIKIEKEWLVKILERIVPCILVLYDYATYKYSSKYVILKISEQKNFKNVWKYLPLDFKQVDIESKLQYKFQNPAVPRWFFRILKKAYKKKRRKKA